MKTIKKLLIPGFMAFLFLFYVLPRGELMNALWIVENILWPGQNGGGFYFVLFLLLIISVIIFFLIMWLMKWIRELIERAKKLL